MTGTICYATESGLGILARQFIQNGLIDKILVWPHSSYKTQNWYGISNHQVKNVEELLTLCDRLIFFETPFDWQIIPQARERGIKTILMAMYECTQYPLPYYPDVLIGGSAMETAHYAQIKCALPCQHINVPVGMPWKLRHRAKVFVHNAGHLGLGGRNGTKELLLAMKYVKSPLKLIVRSQVPLKGLEGMNDPRVEIRIGDFAYNTLFEEGDVFILPEKFGGSFLPMQEAFASGMPVMATDRFPTNSWLPKELLIKPMGYRKDRIGAWFDCAVLDPQKIAAKLDEWYDKSIESFSFAGRTWALENSWEKLTPLYEAL